MVNGAELHAGKNLITYACSGIMNTDEQCFIEINDICFVCNGHIL